MKSRSGNRYPIHRRRKVPKSIAKTPIKVTVDIRPGPASPAKQAQWRRVWRKLVTEAKQEAGHENG